MIQILFSIGILIVLLIAYLNGEEPEWWFVFMGWFFVLYNEIKNFMDKG